MLPLLLLKKKSYYFFLLANKNSPIFYLVEERISFDLIIVTLILNCSFTFVVEIKELFFFLSANPKFPNFLSLGKENLGHLIFILNCTSTFVVEKKSYYFFLSSNKNSPIFYLWVKKILDI